MILDAGMTELMRPALYGSLHRVHALRRGGTLEKCERPALHAGGWELGERHRSAETSLV